MKPDTPGQELRTQPVVGTVHVLETALFQQLSAVSEVSEPAIAATAEQPAHAICFVTMIDEECFTFSSRFLSADCARMIQQLIVLSERQTIAQLQTLSSPLLLSLCFYQRCVIARHCRSLSRLIVKSHYRIKAEAQ